MQLRAAIITVRQVTLAVVQVSPDQTYADAAKSMLQRAQQIFTSLPIMLLAPRIGGHSRSFATFELDQLIREINADDILWQHYTLRPPEEADPPF